MQRVEVAFGRENRKFNAKAQRCRDAGSGEGAMASRSVSRGYNFRVVNKFPGKIIASHDVKVRRHFILMALLLMAWVPCARTDSGTVAVSGDNTRYTWTPGSFETTPPAYQDLVPRPLGLTNITAIAAGSYHFLALRNNGSVVAWGTNTFGQTNVPPNLNDVWKIAAGGHHSLALRSNGTVVVWGDMGVVPALSNIVSIAAASNHCLALTSDGMVVGWGSNSQGELDVPTSATNVVAIAAGGHASLALRSDGTVVAWGATNIANVPPFLTNIVAITASSSHAVGLRADGSTASWGANSNATFYPNNEPVQAVAAGIGHTTVVNKNGIVQRFPTPLFGGGVISPDPVVQWSNIVAIADGDFHQVLVTKMPVIRQQPTNCFSFENCPARFYVVAESSTPMSYQWHLGLMRTGTIPSETAAQGHGPISGATNSTLVTANLSLDEERDFKVVVSNEFGIVTSNWGEVFVSPTPRLLSQGASTNGSFYYFYFQFDGSSGAEYGYEWSTNLVDWTYKSLRGVTGTYQFRDSFRDDRPIRFFRLRWQ